jgi:hypothetical protein
LAITKADEIGADAVLLLVAGSDTGTVVVFVVFVVFVGVAGVNDTVPFALGDAMGGNVTELSNSNRSYAYVDCTPATKPITTVTSIKIRPEYDKLIIPLQRTFGLLSTCVNALQRMLNRYMH